MQNQLPAALVLAFSIALPVIAVEKPFDKSADESTDQASVVQQANQWRAEHRLIDMHQHVDFSTEHVVRDIRIMDAVGIGTVVNLGTGVTTPGKDGAPSEFQRNKELADRLYPGRFVHYMILDYHGWNDADFSKRAVKQ